MTKTIVGTGTEADFFVRGKRVAKQVDRGEPLAETHVVTFEDPVDVAQLLTNARIGLFRAIKAEPASITQIAARLHRDRSAVKRDVDALLRAGLVSVETTVNAGHGMHKVVRALRRVWICTYSLTKDGGPAPRSSRLEANMCDRAPFLRPHR